MGTAAVSHLKLLIPKLYFEAKTPPSSRLSSTDDTLTFGIYIFRPQVRGAPLKRQQVYCLSTTKGRPSSLCVRNTCVLLTNLSVLGSYLQRCTYTVCVCVCVFFPFILDIKFVGRTSRCHTGGRSHRIFHPPSFCGALIFLARRIQPFLSLVDREVEFVCVWAGRPGSSEVP